MSSSPSSFHYCSLPGHSTSRAITCVSGCSDPCTLTASQCSFDLSSSSCIDGISTRRLGLSRAHPVAKAPWQTPSSPCRASVCTQPLAGRRLICLAYLCSFQRLIHEAVCRLSPRPSPIHASIVQTSSTSDPTGPPKIPFDGLSTLAFLQIASAWLSTTSSYSWAAKFQQHD